MSEWKPKVGRQAWCPTFEQNVIVLKIMQYTNVAVVRLGHGPNRYVQYGVQLESLSQPMDHNSST